MLQKQSAFEALWMILCLVIMEKVLLHLSDVSHIKPLLKDYMVQNYDGLYTYYFTVYLFSLCLFIPSSHSVMVE